MATIVNNTANIVYGNGRSGQTSANSNVATTTLLADYAINGDKTALNQSFAPGENLTYQLTVTNEGTQPLYNVTLSDNLGGATVPLTYLQNSALLNYVGSTTLINPTSTNPLVFTIPGILGAGETATITYIATVNSTLPETETTITNTVTISGREGSESGAEIFVTPAPTATLNLGNYAFVNVTKNVSSTQIRTGDTFSYTLVLENTGNVESTNVVVTDVLPTGFTISSIESLTNGVTTTFTPSDYSVDAGTNTLTLPIPSSPKTISVPAAVGGVSGITVVTITGVIS